MGVCLGEDTLFSIFGLPSKHINEGHKLFLKIKQKCKKIIFRMDGHTCISHIFVFSIFVIKTPQQ
jgi:hypothetical protein